MKKKTIVITGCSSGFGLLAALTLSKNHNVIATMRRPENADSSLQSSPNIAIKKLDVCSLDDINTLLSEVPQVDVLINNAGIGYLGFSEDMSRDDYKAQFDTNFFALVNVTNSFLPKLRASKGRIINISSIAGKVATPGLGAYGASKFAVEGYSESLRLELRSFGVDVICIEPGLFNTKILGDNANFGTSSMSENSPYYTLTQKLISRFESEISKRAGDPQVVANLIAKITDCKRPKLRYLVGSDAKIRHFLHRFLPWNWYEALIYRILFPPS